MIGFDYPETPHTRRHGPEGYNSYESYREWLRDEFVFRCVYCLHRERWYGRGTTFHIDHSEPIDSSPTAECSYENLVYACSTCNNAKRAVIGVPDPCKIAFAECLIVKDNGEVGALNASGQKLCDVLRLNSKSNVQDRSRRIRVLIALKNSEPGLYRELMGFPDDLPDLRKLKAPNNTKPEGALNCFFVQRENGTLPETY
jgi:hypothetical protein